MVTLKDLYKKALLSLPGVTSVTINEVDQNVSWPHKATIKVERNNKVHIVSKLETVRTNALWEAYKEMEIFLLRDSELKARMVGIDWGFSEYYPENEPDGF